MNSGIKKYFFLIVLLLITKSYSQIFVAVNGNDTTGNGTINNPYASISKALTVAYADSLIYVRGGTYYPTVYIQPPRGGQQNKYIKIWAYPNEKVVINFSNLTIANSRGFQITKKFIHLKGLEICYAKDNGVYIQGDSNIVENCSIHDNMDSGLQISNAGSYNKIINCDSYRNYDPATNGENADGFAAKLGIGPNNEFRGCRAWNNSDDGWDLYEGGATVIIDNCWAFRNGINIWNDPNFQGDGNGFKLGGNYYVGTHIITRSVAFDQPGKGFDQNNNMGGITVYNCTGWRNGNKNFSFPTNPTTGKHILKNNISFSGSNSIVSTSEQLKNSWLGFTVTNNDFLSLDTALALSKRNSDSSLPYVNFLRLANGSSLINSGVDVGLPYFGSAPDLGAFETDYPQSVDENFLSSDDYNLFTNYPNPFNPSTNILYTLESPENVCIKIFSVNGIEVTTLINEFQKSGKHLIEFDSKDLPSGIYFAQIIKSSKSHIIKMMLIK